MTLSLLTFMIDSTINEKGRNIIYCTSEIYKNYFESTIALQRYKMNNRC